MERDNLLKRAARRVGLSVHRWPTHRFDAMRDCLMVLAQSGFVPSMVIDVGANAEARSSRVAAQPCCELRRDRSRRVGRPKPWRRRRR